MTDSPATSLTPGNWSVTATSVDPAVGTIHVGGNLTQSGSDLSGSMYVVGSMCFDVSQPVSFTGTMTGTTVTLTSTAVNGQVFSVTATLTTGTDMSGTYAITGGCANGDHGTAVANAVPSIGGTWNGAVVGSDGSSVPLSVALTQDPTASADGSFPLTGTLAYTTSVGNTCSVSGTITNAFVAGSYVLMNADTVEKDGSAGSVFYNNVLLDSSTTPLHMTGTYQVAGGDCDGDVEDITLTKQ
ncbi:MAG: hypothetical protein LAO30_22980 [Acidobacteriia bacterium]|nr:hypothetical protein [Terriglobia bacterium]